MKCNLGTGGREAVGDAAVAAISVAVAVEEIGEGGR
jgi:hypothetical protein